MTDIVVIIVSWNCQQYLRDCLRSLQQNGGEHHRRVLVVDNASTDGTPAMVRAEFPKVKLIEAGKNLGFAAANNLGMRESKEQYILLLNPDTEVLPGALDELASFLDENEAAWGVGATLLNTDGSLQRTGVRFPTIWNLFVESLFLDRLFPRTRLFGGHRQLYEDPFRPRQVDFVQGSCLMVRRDPVVTKVGFLDERFFMYFEETDWCKRVWEKGGEIWISPDARVFHHGGGEKGHYDEPRLLHYHRSLFKFMAKHGGILRGLLVRFVIALRIPIRILAWLGVAIVSGRMRAKAMSSVLGYLRTIPLLFTESLIRP